MIKQLKKMRKKESKVIVFILEENTTNVKKSNWN
jgi:hypothetical protein